jgi:hypothetical protein
MNKIKLISRENNRMYNFKMILSLLSINLFCCIIYKLTASLFTYFTPYSLYFVYVHTHIYLFTYFLLTKSPPYIFRRYNSSVGIKTRYERDDSGFETPWGQGILSFPFPPRPLDPPSRLYNGYWDPLLGVKRPGSSVDPSFPT